MGEPANPFDTGDDMNPFGNPSDPVDSYNPFDQGNNNTPSQEKVNKSGLDDFDYYEEPQVKSEPPPDNSAFVSDEQVIEETVDLEEDEESDRDESSKYSIFQIKYYQTLFNVTTTDVLDRVFRAVVPFRMTFFDAIKENPDLYGPFWITCSLVFIMAASGNFANYLAYLLAGQEDKWVYDFNKLPYGAAVIFIYMIVIPLSYWGVLAWIGEFGVKLIQMYCLYGYAMFIYLIAGIICAVPNGIVKWVTVSIACVVSIIHLALSLWPKLSVRKVVGVVTLIVFALLHVGLALSFTLYFFNYDPPKATIPEPPAEIAQHKFF